MKLKVSLLTTLVASSLLSASAYADLLIHAGRLIDGHSDDVRERVTIVVKNDRIAAIEEGYQAGDSDDTVIDRKNATVLPGLIDMHTHITSQLGPNSYLVRYTDNPADVALTGAHFANLTLQSGFTTIRDLGDSFNASISLRNAINAGKVPGPRIFTAGKSIATTGGHGDPSNGHRDGLMHPPGPNEGVVNGPVEAREAVRARYQAGSDVIKLTATGGVLSVAKSGQNPQFMLDELKAVVDTAKDYEMKVTVHAHGKEGMVRAIKAGVNSIEHGTYMDDEVMSLMKEYGVYYVPTITAGKSVAERAEIDGFFPALVRPKARAIGPKIQATFEKAYAAGVKIAFGTDAGVFDHGENYREFGYMVEAGMPPMKAIQAATKEAANLLGNQQIGGIQPGKLADIIAVEGNPLDDINQMKNVNLVIKNGQVYRQE